MSFEATHFPELSDESEKKPPSGIARLLSALRSRFGFGATSGYAQEVPLTFHDLQQHDHIKFIQDLNEVGLLLDHISGHPSKNLSLLTNKICDPNDPKQQLSDFAIVTKVSDIRQKYTACLARGSASASDPKAVSPRDTVGAVPSDPTKPVPAEAQNAAVETKPAATANTGEAVSVNPVAASAKPGEPGPDRPAEEALAETKGARSIDPKDAAFLIVAKDALNSIAYPATGATIAFTTLFTRSSGANRWQSAAIAYPSLVLQAADLKKTKNRLTRAALWLAIVAALMLWQVTYGVQLASHFDEAKKNDSDFAARVYSQLERENPSSTSGRITKATSDVNEACGLKHGPGPQPDAGDTASAKAASSEGKPARTIAMQRLCDDYAYQHALLCVAVADIGRYGTSLPFRLYGLFLPMHELWQADVCGDGKAAWDRGHQEDAKSIAAVLGAMSNYFVPLLFGALGALASLVRSLSDKVADSLLSPRDLTLWLIRLPLAVVAGVCVGLFLSPSSVQSGGGGSIGSFTISASGISFLAGYGAESFFGALDSIISRLFSVGQSASADQARGAASNS